MSSQEDAALANNSELSLLDVIRAGLARAVTEWGRICDADMQILMANISIEAAHHGLDLGATPARAGERILPADDTCLELLQEQPTADDDAEDDAESQDEPSIQPQQPAEADAQQPRRISGAAARWTEEEDAALMAHYGRPGWTYRRMAREVPALRKRTAHALESRVYYVQKAQREAAEREAAEGEGSG
ncbi:hypothetical protein C8A03DRAFT_37693 [Achaetomium macrosporum]|uniref:Uncharacterized protein n=1 Tax=Achaetomium macrosporum TaxID=79813 RepID=A0AAN7C367_9PEZI|nr:hypothetical protein C8A03DRAFT_37693 [Achaetomium macrosporum]